MTALLRADRIRFRRRYDLWIVLIGALLLGALAYWSGVSSANSPASLEPIDPTMPPDLRSAIQASNAAMEAQMAAIRDQYVFPRSVITMLTIGNWIFLAMAFVTASWIATEFEWGTIRSLVLLEPRRNRFLAARIASLIAISMVAIAALVGLGALLPLALPTVGSATSGTVSGSSVALTAAGVLAWCLAFIAVAALAAIATRSPILALIVTFGYFLLEGVVDNAAAWDTWGPPLAWGRQFLLGFRLNALTADVRAATGLRDPFESTPATPPIHLDPAAGLLVIAAWIVLLLAVAVLLLERADIRE